MNITTVNKQLLVFLSKVIEVRNGKRRRAEQTRKHLSFFGNTRSFSSQLPNVPFCSWQATGWLSECSDYLLGSLHSAVIAVNTWLYYVYYKKPKPRPFYVTVIWLLTAGYLQTEPRWRRGWCCFFLDSYCYDVYWSKPANLCHSSKYYGSITACTIGNASSLVLLRLVRGYKWRH